MISHARKLHINGETYHWTGSKNGIVLDLGAHGRFEVGLEVINPENYCWSGCCDPAPHPTPGLASHIARIQLATDLVLEPGVEIDHVWKVTSVRKL